MPELGVVIIGAGPAGVRAAETLAAHGVRPLMIDEAPRSGGQIYRRQPDGFRRPAKVLYGFEATKALGVHSAFADLGDRVDYWPSSTVWSVEGQTLWVRRPDGNDANVPFSRLIVAPGAVDRVMPFEGWTLPGVYTHGAAQIALKYQACHVGSRIALLGTGPLMYLLGYQYRKSGADIVGIFDTTPLPTQLRHLPGLGVMPANLAKGVYYAAWLKLHGVPIHHGVTPVRVRGGQSVEGLELRDRHGRRIDVACDAVAFGYHVQAETQLADLLGCAFELDRPSRQWLPSRDDMGRATRAGVYLAGDGAAVRGADTAEATGRLAAYACLVDMGVAIPEARYRRLIRQVDRGTRFAKAVRQAFPMPDHLLSEIEDGTILCRCEEVTVGTLRGACADLGADETNRAKAFTRVGMGRCQGRMCGLSAMAIVAHALGEDIGDVGRLRGQAPVKPLPIGAPVAGDET